MRRRDFIKATGGTIVTIASSTYAFRFLSESSGVWIDSQSTGSGKKYGMVINLNKCQEGCTACIDACRLENNVAFHGDPRWDIHWIRKARLKQKIGSEEFEKSVILLCNHCDEPPCAQVCPVRATYKRDDGIVIVDHHRCIGCRYCVIACPYNARYFNFKDSEEWANKERPKRSHGVAEACTLCAHRLDKGELPACVEACQNVGAKAITVGDINDPTSEIAELMTDHAVKRLKEDLGTQPKVHYIGL